MRHVWLLARGAAVAFNFTTLNCTIYLKHVKVSGRRTKSTNLLVNLSGKLVVGEKANL
jgi:hypothetical protein